METVTIQKLSKTYPGGIVTEHAQMYDNLTGMENLIFYAAAFGLGPKEGKQRGESLLRELELTEAKDRKLAAYSTGMRQRLSLARALLHRPKVLFLDVNCRIA